MKRHLFAPVRMIGLAGFLVVVSCATNQEWKPPTTLDTGDVPAALRPGYGNAELHTWWPLTAPEVAALQGVDQAKQGDAHALLALAILASNDKRDATSYVGYRQRVDRFLSELRPVMEAAPDDWHRGYELNRAMHRHFFNGHAELDGYQLDQARVTSIFSGGHYNCLSSAMLFAVLARGFGLSVRAALVPTHVFIELGRPGEKVVEVETTSATGFDWVHDDRFYKESAAAWSRGRGLRPATLDDYQHRLILQPYQLMANGMRDPGVAETDKDRYRLYEISALVDADNVEFQKGRIQSYANEAHDLYEAKAWRTTVKLFDTVGPAVSEIGSKSRDAKTLELVSWANWHYAHALMIVGRQDEATALMSDGLDRLDPAWEDAATLKNNYVGVLNDLLCGLIAKNDHPAALKVFTAHREVCRSQDVCASNVGVVYGNWSVEYANAGDWPSARKILQECLAELPNDSRCREALTDLESRHQF